MSMTLDDCYFVKLQKMTPFFIKWTDVSQRPFLGDFTLIKRLLEQMSKYRTKVYRKFFKDSRMDSLRNSIA